MIFLRDILAGIAKVKDHNINFTISSVLDYVDDDGDVDAKTKMFNRESAPQIEDTLILNTNS